MQVQESESMLTGDEIRRARQRAGWSQGELARRLGVAMRTVGNWERGDTSPAQKETALRSVLSDYFDKAQEDHVHLRSASDAELLGEIARRFARSEETGKEVDAKDERQPTVEPAPAAETVEDDDDQDDYELAASYGDEGISPDEDPHTT